jgi:eukaryotic-like serine/threonine-protein kinase
LTAAHSLVGTAEYLSPEQAAGKPVTNRSDLYSFGIVLYTLLVGHPPFRGESVLSLLHKHRFAQFDSPAKINPDIPPELSDVICQLLEKEPSNRPHDGFVLQRQLERIKRRFERKQQSTVVRPLAETQAESMDVEEEEEEESPGPATLMSRLMRQELTSQKQGGPVTQFFNRPIVIISLLAACLGLIGWKAWPKSKTDPEWMFEQGAKLMASDDPADWDRAWTEFLEPLDRRRLDPKQQDEFLRFRKMINDHEARRAVPRIGQSTSEAQRFYEQGQRLALAGDAVGARRSWQNVVRAFDGIEAENQWVRLAKQGLTDLETRAPSERRWDSVRQALDRARQLRDEGKRKEAEAIWQGIEELYQGDSGAKEILKEIANDRNR